MALSDIVGKSTLFLNENSATNSILPLADGAEFWSDNSGDLVTLERIEVSTVRIDEFCQQNSIKHIDILKLDLQGAELKALTGARKMLDRRSVPLIYLEANFVPLYEGQATLNDILRYLSGFYYRIFGFYNLAWSANGRLKWCDVLFFKDSSDEEKNVQFEG